MNKQSLKPVKHLEKLYSYKEELKKDIHPEYRVSLENKIQNIRDLAIMETCEKLARLKTKEEILQDIENHKNDLMNTISGKYLEVTKQQLKESELLLENNNFNSHPRGIDELITDLIEYRAMIYAFSKVEITSTNFIDTFLFKQWVIGSTYVIFCSIGKIISKNQRDNSLKILWDRVSPFSLFFNGCEKEEFDIISQTFDKDNGLFTNHNSKATLFRNKIIAHNATNPELAWDDVDHAIKVICRIWSILSSWSSFCIEPFLSNNQAFKHFESVFDRNEILQLQTSRSQYISLTKEYCTTYLHSGKKDAGGSSFGNFSITCTVSSPNGNITKNFKA